MIEKAYTETSIGQCHYRHQSGQGIPIVFLHQTPSSSLMYEKLMSLLPQNTCVAIDTPGFGMSDDISGNPSIEDYGDCIVKALESLDIKKFPLIGHHSGRFHNTPFRKTIQKISRLTHTHWNFFRHQKKKKS
jgi:Predicted hydrolases or acyltransferases (alpha/beta hydrolase superfamily)